MSLPTGSDVVFDVDPLAHDIDVEASSHRVLQPKIELKLVKKQGGIKWTKLEGEDESLVKMGASNLLESLLFFFPVRSPQVKSTDGATI